MKKKDESLGFAIYAVAKSSIAQSTWQQISIATLGSSGSVQKGDAAVVLGKPFGYAGAVGTIASSRNELDGDDGSYPLLCTDIGAAEDGTGVIINLSGEVVGIIDQGISGNSSKELVTGYGISGLKSEIELLSNGQAVPYIGIRGCDGRNRSAGNSRRRVCPDRRDGFTGNGSRDPEWRYHYGGSREEDNITISLPECTAGPEKRQ